MTPSIHELRSATRTAIAAVALLALAAPGFADHHEQDAHAQGHADEHAEATPAAQVMSLEEMCAANADAMAGRQAEKSLYDRLGGKEKIHEIVVEVIGLHDENEAIKGLMEGVDHAHLIDSVTDFLVAATGGPDEYKGMDMEKAHAHLQLTNADFLAAGGDVMQGMKNKGCGEAEIQELICAFVSLRSQVVIESEREVK